MSIFRLGEHAPDIAAQCFIADTASLVGDIRLAPKVSIWFSAVLRGDNEPIVLGEGSNVQDCAVLHTDPGFPLSIGSGVTVGHGAMVHGCSIGDDCLIGIGAIILNGAKIGKNCLIGAHSLITEGKEIPDNSLVFGSPAKIIRETTDEEQEAIRKNARHYMEHAKTYRQELEVISASTEEGNE
ncbi:MAG: gamma carbonic anhydrase family protein [Parvibaculales bacterium]